jgi:hypothetical protein
MVGAVSTRSDRANKKSRPEAALSAALYLPCAIRT